MKAGRKVGKAEQESVQKEREHMAVKEATPQTPKKELMETKAYQVQLLAKREALRGKQTKSHQEQKEWSMICSTAMERLDEKCPEIILLISIINHLYLNFIISPSLLLYND